MAKRFTDTGKWGKESFSDLPAELKLAWIYLCDTCDHAGVWDINMKLLSFQIGFLMTLEDMMKFGDKIEIIGNKILLPSFVEFQYGTLNPDNRVHLSVINRINSIKQNKPLTSPLQGSKDKDMDKDLDKEKDSEDKKVTPDKINQAWNVWNDTLKSFGIPKTNIAPSQESLLAISIKTLGVENVLLAVEGPRFERPGGDFRPQDYLTLDRVLKKDRFGKSNWERFKNMALLKRSTISKEHDEAEAQRIAEYGSQQ